MLQDVINWFESHQQTCSFRDHFGIDCPGCGLQRSILELLKGNLLESVYLYPALLPMLTMFAYLVLHLAFKFRNGAFILKVMFIVNVCLISLNYLYKLIIL
jgi:hypothetical protein